VSAAAAALLAVAPVAATAMPVNAATAQTPAAKDANTNTVTDTKYTVPGTITLDRGSNTQFSVKLTDNQIEGIIDGAVKNGVDALKGAKPSDLSNFTVTTVKTDVSGDKSVFQQTITFEYNKNTYSVTANAKFASQQGTPYFYNKTSNEVVKDGSTVKLNNISNGFSSADLLTAIKADYAWKTSDASGSNAEMTTTASDIESQLVAQGLKRASNGDFDYPANGFDLKLTAKSEDGNTASITVRINADVNFNAPVFVVKPQTVDDKIIGGQVYYNNNIVETTSGKFEHDSKDIIFNKEDVYNTKDKKFDFASSAVVAFVQNANKNAKNGYDASAAEIAKNQQKVKVTPDTSAVNESVNGIYPVTLTATNPAGYTSKLVVWVAINGKNGEVAVEYVKEDNTKVYTIDGNVVSEAKTDALKKGVGVNTYGKLTVNGVEYTRINSKESNQFVKSSDLTNTKPAETTPAVQTTTKTINHIATAYAKDGKTVVAKNAYHAYDSITVVAEKVNGMYQVVENGKPVEKYVKAGNIDGTSRTVKHNSYVYKNNGKAYTYKKTVKKGKKHVKKTYKKLVKKGENVTTYGSAFTINGHKMYRVGKNQYIKKANF
ncbi:SLAP domain-containing protein, partial [Lactobacillus hamsteri]